MSARHLGPAALCVAFGMLISALPHLQSYAAYGDPTWIADDDELMYLSVAARSLREDPWRLLDPMISAPSPTIFPWLQLAPGILGAKLMGWGPSGISLAWRLWAGATVGLGWYALGVHYLRRPWLASALAIVLMGDAGILWLRPVGLQVNYVFRLALDMPGNLLDASPRVHPQWRLISPGLSLGPLLIHVWLAARALERPTMGRVAAAGIGFGVLFYVYFYAWTASGLALAILGLAAVARRRWPASWTIGLIGTVVGAPAVVSGMMLRRSAAAGWLQRSDKFLPIGRLDELLLPKVAIAAMVVAAVWVARRRRDLAVPCAYAASGLILLNHQMFTKLQIENFHYGYVWAPCLSLTLWLLAMGPGGSRASTRLAWLVVAPMAASGLWLRGVEASRTADPRAILDAYRAYRADPPGLPAGAVAAGDRRFVELSTVLGGTRPLNHYAAVFSPAVGLGDWERRVATDALLRGEDRAAFERRQRAFLDETPWGPWARDKTLRRARLADRLRWYDEAAVDPMTAADRHGVRFVATAVDARPPGRWRRLHAGARWAIWGRVER